MIITIIRFIALRKHMHVKPIAIFMRVLMHYYVFLYINYKNSIIKIFLNVILLYIVCVSYIEVSRLRCVNIKFY